MEPINPAAFPRRVKRYQSYSMTPLDFQADHKNSPQLPPSTIYNKFNSKFNKPVFQPNTPSTNTNPDTNQFSTLRQTDPSGSIHKNLKPFHNSQLQQTFNEPNSIQNTPVASDYKKHRKMVTSDIFMFSSMMNKNSFSDDKNHPTINQKFRNLERKNLQSQFLEKQVGRTENKEKEIRVPSFLLNKKKQGSNNELGNNGAMTERDMSDSTPVFSSERLVSGNCGNRGSFKKPSILMMNENRREGQSQFHPPCNDKIVFSKATASTLCTNLPREESRRTFRDFEEMVELKQIQNSMEESDKSKCIKREFESLFERQEQGELVAQSIENEIAELFSDEDLESEEFNEELKNELEDLF